MLSWLYIYILYIYIYVYIYIYIIYICVYRHFILCPLRSRARILFIRPILFNILTFPFYANNVFTLGNSGCTIFALVGIAFLLDEPVTRSLFVILIPSFLATRSFREWSDSAVRWSFASWRLSSDERKDDFRWLLFLFILTSKSLNSRLALAITSLLRGRLLILMNAISMSCLSGT